MSTTVDVSASGHSNGRPTSSDIAFLALLVFVLLGVALMGSFNFREGQKTEATKAQAEALLAWLAQAQPRRAAPDFELPECARRAGQDGQASGTWAQCARALRAQSGPMAGARNVFSGQPLQFIARCDPSQAATVGQLAIEKISFTPPGSAVPSLAAPIADDEPLDKSMTIKVLACDKGGYPIKVGEVEF